MQQHYIVIYLQKLKVCCIRSPWYCVNIIINKHINRLCPIFSNNFYNILCNSNWNQQSVGFFEPGSSECVSVKPVTVWHHIFHSQIYNSNPYRTTKNVSYHHWRSCFWMLRWSICHQGGKARMKLIPENSRIKSKSTDLSFIIFLKLKVESR